MLGIGADTVFIFANTYCLAQAERHECEKAIETDTRAAQPNAERDVSGHRMSRDVLPRDVLPREPSLGSRGRGVYATREADDDPLALTGLPSPRVVIPTGLPVTQSFLAGASRALSWGAVINRPPGTNRAGHHYP